MINEWDKTYFPEGTPKIAFQPWFQGCRRGFSEAVSHQVKA